MMKFWLICIFLTLFGCAGLPQAEHFQTPEIRQYQITDSTGADSLVIGEYQPSKQWRWLAMNALGVPLARQIYQEGKWKNDGFLPPNQQVRTLFTAIMLADQFAYFPDIEEKIKGKKRQFIYHGKLWLETAPIADNHLLLQTEKGHWQMKRLAVDK